MPQIVVGLAVTRDGLPVRHWVFLGNTVDVTTVAQVKADSARLAAESLRVRGRDVGMVSEENLRSLSQVVAHISSVCRCAGAPR